MLSYTYDMHLIPGYFNQVTSFLSPSPSLKYFIYLVERENEREKAQTGEAQAEGDAGSPR